MCNDKDLFIKLRSLETPQEVMLGDGHLLQATAEGTVTLKTLLLDGTTKTYKLQNVLLVPKLPYSLLSVSKAGKAGIINKDDKVIIFATKVGNFYSLKYCRKLKGKM